MQYRVAAHGPTLHRPSHSPQGPRKSIGLSKGVIRQSPEWQWSGPRQLRTAGLPRRLRHAVSARTGAERLAQAVFAGVIHNQDHGCLGSIGFCRCSLFDRVRPHTPCSRLRLVPIEHRLHYPLPFMLGLMYSRTQRILWPPSSSLRRAQRQSIICARAVASVRGALGRSRPSVSASAPEAGPGDADRAGACWHAARAICIRRGRSTLGWSKAGQSCRRRRMRRR